MIIVITITVTSMADNGYTDSQYCYQKLMHSNLHSNIILYIYEFWNVGTSDYDSFMIESR